MNLTDNPLTFLAKCCGEQCIEAFYTCESYELQKKIPCSLHFVSLKVFEIVVNSPLAKTMLNHVAFIEKRLVTPLLHLLYTTYKLDIITVAHDNSAKLVCRNLTIFNPILTYHIGDAIKVYNMYPLSKQLILTVFDNITFDSALVSFLEFVDTKESNPTWIKACFATQSIKTIAKYNIDLLLYLINRVGDCSIWCSKTDNNQCILLHYMSASSLKHLLEKISLPLSVLHMQNNLGQTILHLATQHGDSDLINLILQLGVDWTKRDYQGKTAKQLALPKQNHLFPSKRSLEEDSEQREETNQVQEPPKKKTRYN